MILNHRSISSVHIQVAPLTTCVLPRVKSESNCKQTLSIPYTVERFFIDSRLEGKHTKQIEKEVTNEWIMAKYCRKHEKVF